MKFSEFRQLLTNIVPHNSNQDLELEPNEINLWKLDPNENFEEFVKYVKNSCKKSKTSDYIINFKGKFYKTEKNDITFE